MLVPTRSSPSPASTTQGANVSSVNTATPGSEAKERDVMDDLVDQLVALETKNSSRISPPGGTNKGG